MRALQPAPADGGFELNVKKRLIQGVFLLDFNFLVTMDLFRPRSQCFLIVATFVVDHFHRLHEIRHLPFHGGFPFHEEVVPFLEGGVAFGAPVDEGFDILDGHAGGFQAFDDAERADVGILEEADAVRTAFHEGHESFFVIIAEGIDGEVQFLGDFADGVGFHEGSSFHVHMIGKIPRWSPVVKRELRA
ncbi:hypothetical protein BACI349Y_640044 [Bacillus sp. 349Y]|nr:hypothetical protein BACI349Y_640044 [Bacillus sp. 349Y]